MGYFAEDKIEPSTDAEGWYHTGDLGTLDANGYLHVKGRKDNLFISGGENIQPEEIEQALGQLDGVRRAVVVPVPDDEFGFRPVAFILGEAEPAMLGTALRQSLPGFKIPVAFYPWPAQDGTPGETARMKIERSVFQEEARRLWAERS